MSIGPFTFTGFDIAVLLVCLISLLMAMSRGFAREIVSLLALIIAGAVALFVFGQFRFAAQDFIQPAFISDWVLGLGSFALTFILVSFLLNGIVKSLKGKEVGFIDRLFAVGFGIFRGLLLCSLVVMFKTIDYKQDQQNRIELETMTPEQREGALRVLPDPVELDSLFVDSTLYPVLDKIGDGIRLFPFAKIKSLGERLKDGNVPDLDDLKTLNELKNLNE